jgi:hypothetical protein
LPSFLVGKGGNRFEKGLQRETKRGGLTRKKKPQKQNYQLIVKLEKMSRRILGGIALLAIAAVAAWNVNLSTKSNNLSSISLANVEALADDEDGGDSGWKKVSTTITEYEYNEDGSVKKTKTYTADCCKEGNVLVSCTSDSGC